MPDTDQRRRNSALWWGLILTLLGVAGNSLYFFTSAPSVFTWLSLLVSATGVVLLLLGLKRAFGQPQVFRGKIAGSILTVTSAIIFGLSTWLFFHARDVPVSAGAPKVGEKAPDFTLTNTSGQPVSLNQMLSLPFDSSTGARPKAVLLVFYRGYW
jgi:hypothetical protein